MSRGIMRLNRLGRRKIGKKFYTEYRTTPAYVQDALEALRGDYKEVKPPIKEKNNRVIILVRGFKRH